MLAKGMWNGHETITPRDAIVTAEEIAAQCAYLDWWGRWCWRVAFGVGREMGDREGYARARFEQEQAWREVARRVAAGAYDPTFAELQLRRRGVA